MISGLFNNYTDISFLKYSEVDNNNVPGSNGYDVLEITFEYIINFKG